MTDNRQTTRTFQCREALWACFEQMARELECSVDYLLNDAMKQYARQRGYNSMGADSHSPSPTSSMPPSLRPSTPMMRAPLPPAPMAPQAAPLPPVPPPGRQAPYYPPPAARAGGMQGVAPPSQPAVRRPPPAPLPPPPAARQMPAQAGYYVPSSVPPTYANQAAAPMGAPSPMGGPGMGGPGMGGPGMGHGMGGPGMGGPGMGGPGMNGPGMNGPGMGGAMGGPATGGGRPTVNIYYMGERYPVTKDRFIIGRGRQSSDLTIKDPNVSRQHAMIEYLNGYYYIVDMGSTNGVEYAGQRIQRRVVGEGDTFRVCDHELRFSYH